MESLQFVYPEIVLAIFALGLVILGAFSPSRKTFGILALSGVIMSILFLPLSCQMQRNLFFGMLVNDAFSVFFRQIILLIAFFVLLLSIGYKEGNEDDRGEYYFFILTVTLSMLLAVSTNNLLMIYLTLEAVSVISYLLAGYSKRDVFSSEAGMKYFIFGSLSTGITLYAISLIYGLFRTLDLPLIFSNLAFVGESQSVLLFASILLLVGFGFKCSLVPFHMWTPDIYEGAPTPVAALLSVGPKAMGFAFLLRVFLYHFQPLVSNWFSLAGTISLLTMTIGNVMALRQNNIKRLLAYSTIAQAGYILLGLAIGTPEGSKATLFYIFVYTLMNLGAFGAVIAISNNIKSETIEDYAGFYTRDPFTAIFLTVSLLSLAGIPPLAGFLAKFFILAAVVESQYILLAVITVINSVIAVYYYMNVIKVMFFCEPKDSSVVHKNLTLNLALSIATIGIVIIGIWPNSFIAWLTGLLYFK